MLDVLEATRVVERLVLLQELAGQVARQPEREDVDDGAADDLVDAVADRQHRQQRRDQPPGERPRRGARSTGCRSTLATTAPANAAESSIPSIAMLTTPGALAQHARQAPRTRSAPSAARSSAASRAGSGSRPSAAQTRKANTKISATIPSTRFDALLETARQLHAAEEHADGGERVRRRRARHDEVGQREERLAARRVQPETRLDARGRHPSPNATRISERRSRMNRMPITRARRIDVPRLGRGLGERCSSAPPLRERVGGADVGRRVLDPVDRPHERRRRDEDDDAAPGSPR